MYELILNLDSMLVAVGKELTMPDREIMEARSHIENARTVLLSFARADLARRRKALDESIHAHALNPSNDL